MCTLKLLFSVLIRVMFHGTPCLVTILKRATPILYVDGIRVVDTIECLHRPSSAELRSVEDFDHQNPWKRRNNRLLTRMERAVENAKGDSEKRCPAAVIESSGKEEQTPGASKFC
ncbi:hypothetical protein KIN20_031262 [Parelaphostrongylus tenuis]|uniref:Secreted protein n=1 Tax=Parelaphostrongylus tenuis TaxID=148309 RepID=A0AAD5R571_PARTN|nr:hypothetical protein KIN20_031262 [Parelaphostrongylus tenuis]